MFIGDDGAPPDETYSHFGFKIIDGSVYASNCDDSIQKITDTGVDLSEEWQWTRLKVVVNPGVDCKFYVDGILKVTHTDNLPIEAGFYLNMGVQVKVGHNLARQMRLGRVLLEKAYI